MEVIFAFDLACKKKAAHRARGADDAQHAEEGGRVLVGGHFFLMPKGQDNGRVEIQVNLKFSKIERKISKINFSHLIWPAEKRPPTALEEEKYQI